MPAPLSRLHRTAFLTGASAGLGRAFAEMLLAEDVSVWGTSRDPVRLEPLASSHPSRFFPVALDLADPAGAERAWNAAAAAAGGAFDLVINNAGYGVFGEFAAVAPEAWRAQLDAMLGVTLGLAHAAYRSLRARRRGCLVNVTSLAVEFPVPFMAGYNAAKAGLAALSESLIFESRGTDVRVIDFRPGDYRTDFNRAMSPPSPLLESSPRLRAAWEGMERVTRASPLPPRAAADLRRALRRNRSGVVRSGSFFQARLAPLLARLVPDRVRRAAVASYFSP